MKELTSDSFLDGRDDLPGLVVQTEGAHDFPLLLLQSRGALGSGRCLKGSLGREWSETVLRIHEHDLIHDLGDRGEGVEEVLVPTQPHDRDPSFQENRKKSVSQSVSQSINNSHQETGTHR